MKLRTPTNAPHPLFALVLAPLVAALSLLPMQSTAQSSATAESASASANTTATASATASAATEAVAQLNATPSALPMKEGAKGPGVMRAQALLDRLWFSPGEIDGHFGVNMKRTVQAFQLSRSLPTTGVIDEATWKVLSEGQAAAFTTYTLTEQDMAAPYAPLPKDVAELAKLPALGYETPMEMLAERFHMSPKALAKLNAGRTARAGETFVVTDTSQTVPLGAAVTSIRIDKSDKKVYLLGEGDRLLAAFPATFGREDRDPLPLGRLKIVSEVKDPYFDYNPALLKTAKPDDPKVRLQPGPNNPVGVMWLGLTKKHWGIHGTNEPSTLARASSNGCVRLSNWDVLRVASVVKPGAVVDVQG
ncbi:L,D-transpeptidase family protein [Ramlibacter sp.]|uniref:L,D-transpeptidase family protein n=1 Tax=Ramlibacter sp. TaxID=1917967 RepID=UPI003D10B35A